MIKRISARLEKHGVLSAASSRRDFTMTADEISRTLPRTSRFRTHDEEETDDFEDPDPSDASR